jgi:hypothetical protein
VLAADTCGSHGKQAELKKESILSNDECEMQQESDASLAQRH